MDLKQNFLTVDGKILDICYIGNFSLAKNCLTVMCIDLGKD